MCGFQSFQILKHIRSLFYTGYIWIDTHLYMNYIALYFQEIKRNKHLDTIKCGTKSVPRSVMLKLPNYEKRRRGWIPRKCGTHEILGYPISENTIRAKCLVFVTNQLSGVQPRRVLFSIIENHFKLLKLPSVLNILWIRAYTNFGGSTRVVLCFLSLKIISNCWNYRPD